MPYMIEVAPLEETVLLADGTRLALRIALEAGAPVFRLDALREGERLVRYAGGASRATRQVTGARAEPYAFRSVEQLRYDFERDLEVL